MRDISLAFTAPDTKSQRYRLQVTANNGLIGEVSYWVADKTLF
jgi:hypothetical protein